MNLRELIERAGFEPDCASKEWHERMDRFAALVLEEAARIAEAGAEDRHYIARDAARQIAQEIRTATLK